jgi:hypothetical protein
MIKPLRNTGLRFLTVLLGLATVCGQTSQEAKGGVCAGFNGSIFPEDQGKNLYFTVGESEKLYFDPPGTIVLNNLDLHKTYVVRVFNRGEQIQSWRLRFDKLNVRMVTIWRSPGYWRMDPTPSGKCRP